MKGFAWSPEKNEWLKAVRGISFEDAVTKIAAGDVLGIIDHANAARYPNQRIFVIESGGYAFLVPFVESETEVFLKTIIPSRKATKRFLGRGQGHGQTD